MTNKKILISSIAGAIVAGLAIAVAMVTIFGNDLRYPTQDLLLGAVPTTAQAELGAKGHQLAEPLSCQNMVEATKENMLVSCTGTTSANLPVQVFGAAMEKSKHEYYTILVSGKPLVKNARCLGADCKDD